MKNNSDNPFVILGMTRAEAATLAQSNPDGRKAALNLLRRYYALLFHPDRNPTSQVAMKQINEAVDKLLTQDPQIYLESFSPLKPLPGAEQERWLKLQLLTEQNRIKELLKEINRNKGRIHALETDDRLQKKEAKVASLQKDLGSLRKRSSTLYSHLGWYRRDLLEWRALELPQAIFFYVRVKSPRKRLRISFSDVWLEQEEEKGRAKEPEWVSNKKGHLIGFINKNYLEDNKLKTSTIPDPITFRSSTFDRIMQGAQNSFEKRCGVVVSNNNCLWLYGRVWRWEQVSENSIV